MTRTKKTILGIVLLLLVVAIAIVIFIATFDLNRLKPTINEKVTAELHRPFAINGDLGVQWSRQRDEAGWRAWVPWPHLHAEDVVLGNPPDVPGDYTARLKRVEASISPLALLHKEVYLPRITLFSPDAALRRLANGKNNWTFNLANSDRPQQDTPPSAWSFKVDDIAFDQGKIDFLDPITKADIHMTVNPLGKPIPYAELAGASTADNTTRGDAAAKSDGNDKVAKTDQADAAAKSDEGGKTAKTDKADAAAKTDSSAAGTPVDAGRRADDYIFGWKVTGKYNNESLSGDGKIGGMLALRSSNRPFPLQADVRSGATRVTIQGTLEDPMSLGGLDLRLRLAGDNLGDLHGLTGIVLPDSPPYSTDGHLIAHFKGKDGGHFRYEKFNGKIGSSDIHGTLEFAQGKPRPSLTGEVVSNELRFADLGPLIGADTGTETGKQKAKTQSVQPADKVLPYDKFDTAKWDTMDADVKFTGKRIEHGKNLPLSDLYTHVKLDDGVLVLDPLRFGMARGNLNSTIRLEGNKTPMRGRADLHARGLQLKALFPDVEAMRSSMGQLNGDAQFTGTGNSVAALLGSANGDVRVLMNDGVISRNLMEIAGLNVGNYVVGKLFGDDQVKINCAAADLGVRNGLATPRLFVFDTENAVINIAGTTNLASERLDLSINPDSKGVRIVTLRSPLYVRGTFKHPDAGVKPGPLIARGAVAVALGAVLTPAAALLALISPSGGEENQCGPILQEMKNKK
ncbi:AsmA family protein [Acerihabitans arboris]|uniref:AsmA family protein n=1 Tax=Acerihabitans arboris TaxID=2691583 RepID=A0A845SMJ9_9GAMM|nr:AsmA family protein [Acerihabitans arboris]NDL64622.1 AsmA family protein [Acerihabitans arboris]